MVCCAKYEHIDIYLSNEPKNFDTHGMINIILIICVLCSLLRNVYEAYVCFASWRTHMQVN